MSIYNYIKDTLKQSLKYLLYNYSITINGTSISSLVKPQCVDFFTGFPSAKYVCSLIMESDIEIAK